MHSLSWKALRCASIAVVVGTTGFVFAALVSADPQSPTGPATTTNPLLEDPKKNPLLDDDPFVGTFKGTTLTLMVRQATDGSLEGTIKKGEQSFPFKAKREGDALVGSFSAGDTSFMFTGILTGNTLSFKTSDREFKLEREGAPVAAKPPVPNPPIPTKPPEPVTPPATTTSLPAGPVAKPGKAWDGFAPGSYVLMEDVLSPRGKLPKSQRAVLLYQGTDDGKEIVQLLTLNQGKWEPRGKAVPWMATSKSAADLGYTVGKTTSEVLEVGGLSLVCTVTDYSREEDRDGRRGTSRLQIWKSPGVELPPQTLILSVGGVLLEPGVVRITNVGDTWSQGKVDYKLVALKQPHRIGDRDIRVAIFKGSESHETQEAKLSIVHERMLSSEVPGGIVKLVQERRAGDEIIATTSGRAVEFGVWKGAAAMDAKEAKEAKEAK